jgi:hypothetical protein
VKEYLSLNHGILKGFDDSRVLGEVNQGSVGNGFKYIFAWTVMGGYNRIRAQVTVRPGGSFSVKYSL